MIMKIQYIIITCNNNSSKYQLSFLISPSNGLCWLLLLFSLFAVFMYRVVHLMEIWHMNQHVMNLTWKTWDPHSLWAILHDTICAFLEYFLWMVASEMHSDLSMILRFERKLQLSVLYLSVANSLLLLLLDYQFHLQNGALDERIQQIV